MDVLTDILRTVQLKSAVYFQKDFCGNWGMDVAQGPFAQFHLVLDGECSLEVEEQTIRLQKGDIVVFPTGTPHLLQSETGISCQSGMKVVQTIMQGAPIFDKGAVSTRLVCGHFELDQLDRHPFFQSLPSVIHLPENDLHQTQLEPIVSVILAETAAPQHGSSLVVNRLAEVLLIHIFRSYLQQATAVQGYLGALTDRPVYQALQLIHQTPEKPWTLAQLAQQAGVSRTSLATRFKSLVGLPPMSYMTEWRMIKAREKLSNGSTPIGIVAEEVGYRSEAAFNRVFKRTFQQTPGAFRRTNKQLAQLS